MNARWLARVLLRGALVSLLGYTPSAAASPLFELVGAGGSGGLNARALGASAASTYFNPSLLPRAKAGLDVGWLVLHDAISVDLDARSPSDDVPASALDRVRSDQPPVPTEWLEQGCTPATGGCVRDVNAAPRQGAGSSGAVRGYQLLGLVNHLLADRLSLGLYALVPLKSFTQSHSFFVDEREQFFSNSLHPELYSDRLTPVSLAFGAGSRVWRDLYLGLSFTLGLNNAANAGAYVGNSRLLAETLQLSTKVDVATRVSPHVAISYLPTSGSSVSFVLHSPQRIVIDTEFDIYLPNGDLQHARRTATHSYLPWIAALAGSYDLSRKAGTVWALAATATFERWSQYVNRQSERPLPGYGWHDTVTSTLGIHYQRDRWSLLLDANYRPSPVPQQTGRTNYVDNDRYGVALGGGYEWSVPTFDLVLRMSAQAQLHVLPERHVRKLAPNTVGQRSAQGVVDEWPDDSVDVTTGAQIAEAAGLQTNNPGYPGYRSGGFVAGGTFTLSLLY